VIVTVTLNAALDVAYDVAGVSWESDSEVSRVRYRAGGRGVAVARVLHKFGHDVVAGGLAGGAAGEMIREDLARSGIPGAFTHIAGESRRVLAITDTARGGRTARFREPGPYVTTEELGRFAADYRRLLADAAAVVLCGSLPAGLPPEIYGSLASWASEAGVPVILSAGGSALWHGAARRPGLVIPDVVIPGAAGSPRSGAAGPVPGAAGPEAGAGGLPLSGAGADAALLGLGAAAVAIPADCGVRAVTAAGQWSACLVSGEAPGSQGALVAGLVPGLLLGWSWPDRLRHALAVAVAADESGEVDLAVYESLLDAVRVEQAAGLPSP
jgi:tagatose 6-phosphate kinase